MVSFKEWAAGWALRERPETHTFTVWLMLAYQINVKIMDCSIYGTRTIT